MRLMTFVTGIGTMNCPNVYGKTSYEFSLLITYHSSNARNFVRYKTIRVEFGSCFLRWFPHNKVHKFVSNMSVVVVAFNS